MPVYDITRRVTAASLPEAFNALAGETLSIVRIDTPEEVVPDSGQALTLHATKAQIKASVTAEHLISFEDGRRYKTLKRHLSKHGLTIQQYREKWGLPADYPSTAPAYSEQRSKLAKDSGLGKK